MDEAADTTAFQGAKVALLCGDGVISLLRDDKPGLPFANMWDLPGGGREGAETPEETVLRETLGEVGLDLPQDRLIYKSQYRALLPGPPRGWFFGGWLTEAEVAMMVLGDEGQAMRLMPVAEFLNHPQAIPSLQSRLTQFLATL
ncbi:NUDIX hydrolase [Actibacterium sp. 188UL27-1]|uniref:NUDIX hydrolase n=1 Tax=Actibacterium sp. 188UL27-1 TaxID=2786961 RepID=UPI001956C91B|nr:NUDIX hydrolase [Actibacterium sp. 188UL27-1]MBM7068953.1 NUDIX hydrolase [Actibacterium sp. 188UL27-1]